MEKVQVIFQDIIHCNPVTWNHKLKCVIKNAGKKPLEKSIQKIPS